VVADGAESAVAKLKAEPGKDVWLFGGSSLFRSLLDAGLVDAIEVAVIPVLLGEGIPLLPGGPRSPGLELTHSEVLPSGIVRLSYAVGEPAARP
jgi:dihydrofolate reductase